MSTPPFFVILGRYAGRDTWRFRDAVVIQSRLQGKDSIMVVGVAHPDQVASMPIRIDQIADLCVGQLPARLRAGFRPHSDLAFKDIASAELFIRELVANKPAS